MYFRVLLHQAMIEMLLFFIKHYILLVLQRVERVAEEQGHFLVKSLHSYPTLHF